MSKIKLLYISIFSLILLQSCKRDNSSTCPDPTTTYYKNIDTTNLPYKKGKSFTYTDKNGDLIVVKSISDTIFYNCILQPVSIPDCGTQNTKCHINKIYVFDKLSNVRLDSYTNKLFIIFNGSSFSVFIDALINTNTTYYPYYDSISINNKVYNNVRLVTNTNNDTLFINYTDGILKTVNSLNTFSINK
ncbi:MAG: hypothetical protein NTU43_03205 [Bacteroidetes bacterium]|nr:hypothetical protein [Bacteroidota bacterium]